MLVYIYSLTLHVYSQVLILVNVLVVSGNINWADKNVYSLTLHLYIQLLNLCSILVVNSKINLAASKNVPASGKNKNSGSNIIAHLIRDLQPIVRYVCAFARVCVCVCMYMCIYMYMYMYM